MDPAGNFHGKPLSWSRLERYLSGKEACELRALQSESLEKNSTPVQYYSPRSHVELHAASCFNFLRGASTPEEMIEAAVAVGVEAISLQDRDGFYGVVAMAEAAAAHGIATVFGAELTLDTAILSVICKNPRGYQLLSELISQAKMAGDKDHCHYPDLQAIATQLSGHCYILASAEWAEEIETLYQAFGAENILLEYVVSMSPTDSDAHALLDALHTRYHGELAAIVTTRACAAHSGAAPVAQAKQALERNQALSSAAPQLAAMGAMWLRPRDHIESVLAPHHRRYIDHACTIARECAFQLTLISPNLPQWEVPEGHDEFSWLEALVHERFPQRYRTRDKEIRHKAEAQIAHELSVIKQLGFPGYFLIVSDLVDFARTRNILCQGRGSAANSAVCFALGITNVEPVAAGLLFERFLSPDRDGPPDIDVDFESTRREEVIQYCYERYGRENAAQVANIISYRHKGAIRDAARALGYAPGASDSWSKGITEPPQVVSTLANQLCGHPRHLGIHSGGMVICDRPISSVVPIEWARKKGRSVVQWDKEACASAGLVKFDLLGLGMLEALHHMIDLVKESTGDEINLWELDLSDPNIYEMLSRGDAIGVFQVESRAQLNTLPRLKPRCFFDLVVEVALVRPGPIQGGSVHPYLRRRSGVEEISFDHPVLEKSLSKTLGVPLFQEQLMHIAVDAAGFTGTEADALRRAMGSRRSAEKMSPLKKRFYSGLRETNGITGKTADKLWNKIVAFAAYGFPESHAQSFASLVYFSAWFKYYYPAQFCVGLMRAQPMGFYSPQSLLADARRHGIRVLPVCINSSRAEPTVEKTEDGWGIRIGLNSIKGLHKVSDIVAHAPYSTIADVARRADVKTSDIEALAQAGALDIFGTERRQALWQAGIAATEKPDMLPGLSVLQAPSLPGMNAFELAVADIATTGLTHDKQPMVLFREYLDSVGIIPAAELLNIPDGTRIRVAGTVTHRQKPATAGEVTFIGMEDETGLINVVITPGLWKRQHVLARTATVLIVRGIVRNANRVASISADLLEEFSPAELLSAGSRDFH
ncbi:error-prone DNA polymerase [Corynebacterium sp. ES2715-CONJ3]|uniref:error-prone DNA polymerase n=1 Tax=Corynebacterium sp. ES2715-CONJ3 TaxID=2974028 RepID=UPI0021679BC0|nr:error-prone DNA polymerase [Corynebacterium sp. ES2715-CONJ3]MCS4491444.1 error-prone DNA polymerase [Corynebacterium sp. ES2715-CONJ3]